MDIPQGVVTQPARYDLATSQYGLLVLSVGSTQPWWAPPVNDGTCSWRGSSPIVRAPPHFEGVSAAALCIDGSILGFASAPLLSVPGLHTGR